MRKQFSAEKRLLALHIVRILNKAQDGDLYDPATWLAVAHRRNIVLMSHRVQGLMPGHYVQPRLAEGRAIIEWCAAEPSRAQARTLYHELGHDVLYRETTRDMFGEKFLHGFDGDPKKFVESVCRLAEEMKFGKRGS